MAKKVRAKPVEETPVEIDFSEVRKMVRDEIKNRYGSVAEFLKSDAAEEFGGMKIKVYLYDSGPVNFKIIEQLCTFLGLGDFTRDVVVTRTYHYHFKSSKVTE